MPDVLTHLLVGISIALLVRREGPKSEQMLIVFGAVLIDIERPISWVLSNTTLDWIAFSSAFHSILGAIALSYIAGACFHLESITYRRCMGWIFLGCVSHLILDMIMYPWNELGIPLLYPLNLAFSFHLLWPDYWWYPLLGLVALTFTAGVKHIFNHYARIDTAKDILGFS